MINMNIVEEMRNLSALNYSPDAVKAFLTNFSLEKILDDFLTVTNRNQQDSYIVTTTTKKLINDPATFKHIISEPSLKSTLEAYLKHDRRVYREMIADAIMNNTETTLGIFRFFKDQVDNPVIEGYIKIIYYLFQDPETSIGMKMSKFFSKVSETIGDDKEIDYLFNGELALTLAKGLLTGDDAVIELRFLEMMVLVGNRNQRLYTLFNETGLMNLGLKLYKKYANDILEKLNLVDIVGKMGMTEIGAEILSQHHCFKLIKKEALSPDADPFATKSLGLLLLDLMTHGKIKYTSRMMKDLEKRLTHYFLTGFGEELYTCYDMIASFGKSVEGFMAMFKNKKVLGKLAVLCHSNTDMEHKKALATFGSLFSSEKVWLAPAKKRKTLSLAHLNEDTNRSVEFTVIYLAQPQLLESYIDITDITYLDSVVKFFFKNLLLPFSDIEQIFLKLTLCMTNIDKFLIRFCKNKDALEYLIKKPTKGKITFDLKNELKTKMWARIEEVQKIKKEPFFETFLAEWDTQKKKKRVELMQYTTSTN